MEVDLDHEISRALDVATALAFEAGAVTMRYFGTDLRVDDKGHGDPVTEHRLHLARQQAEHLPKRAIGVA